MRDAAIEQRLAPGADKNTPEADAALHKFYEASRDAHLLRAYPMLAEWLEEMVEGDTQQAPPPDPQVPTK